MPPARRRHSNRRTRGAAKRRQLLGEVGVRIGAGRLAEVDPGAGRMFGLLSVVALPRRLALDFRDVFGKGAFAPALALAASALAGRAASRRRGLAVAQVLRLGCLAYAAPADPIGLQMSPFKGLTQALEVVDARKRAERSGPLGLLTVVESPAVPFRHVPGLSFNTRHLPPDQLAVFTDGDGMSVITSFNGDPAVLGYLGDVTAALPYRLLDRPRHEGWELPTA